MAWGGVEWDEEAKEVSEEVACLSQGPLLTPSGTTGETEVVSRPESGDCIHTAAILAAHTDPCCQLARRQVGPLSWLRKGRRRLPFAFLSSWQKQHSPRAWPGPISSHKANDSLGLGNTPGQNSHSGGREHSFAGPRGNKQLWLLTKCFDVRTYWRKTNCQTRNGC